MLKKIKNLPWSPGKRIYVLIWVISSCLLFDNSAMHAQESTPLTEIFHSTQSANLPTAMMLRSGEGILEISHRFLPPISDGPDVLWGLDGPAYNRLGLGFAVTDKLLLGVLRSSLEDNLEVNTKVHLAQKDGSKPWVASAVLGSSWDFESNSQDLRTEVYLQLILNTLLTDKIAIGVVPSLLRGVSEEGLVRTDFAFGLNGQFSVSRRINLIAEWIATKARSATPNDVGTFGIEFRTRGHFFKILLSNQVRMNPSQYLAGSPFGLHPKEWRLGFNVIRILRF